MWSIALIAKVAPAGSWSGTEAGNGDSFGAGSAAPDSEYGTPDNNERQAMLTEGNDVLVRNAPSASCNRYQHQPGAVRYSAARFSFQCVSLRDRLTLSMPEDIQQEMDVT